MPGQIPGQLPGQNQINPTNTNPNGFGTPQPIPPQVPGQSAFPQPGQFQPQTGSGPNPIANPAVGMIQTMLTTPRQQSTDSNFGSGTGGAAGLAGVATKFTGPSIKVYKDHQKYQEWEFIFDLKQGLPGQPTPGNGPGTGQGSQQPGQQQNGQGTFAPSNTFGTSANPTTPPTPPQQPPQQQQQQQQN